MMMTGSGMKKTFARFLYMYSCDDGCLGVMTYSVNTLDVGDFVVMYLCIRIILVTRCTC